MSTQPVWRVSAVPLAWREFDGEVVVYHDGTGCTHHLGALGSGVLLALAEHPAGLAVDALAQRLSPDHDDAHALEGDIESTLRELAQFELATPIGT